MSVVHKCERFRKERVEGPWFKSGALREREIQQASICIACGRQRPSKFRRIVSIEKEASSSAAIFDPELRLLARKIHNASPTRSDVGADRFIRKLNGVHTEIDIERLACAAPIRLIYRRSGGAIRLYTIRILDRAALAEIAQPGLANRRAALLAQARAGLEALTNPEALSIRDVLEADSAERLDERVVKALAALARLLERGDAIPAKAFAAEVLGSSKALPGIRSRLERIVGPLTRLGIRDWGGLVMLAGQGVLHLPNCDLRLNEVRCLGVSSDDMLELRGITLPVEGILVIENLTPFQACLEALHSSASVLLVWSGGFPNRGVKKLLEEASRQRRRLRVWCDVDLGGIRIARMIHEITSGIAEPILMDPEILDGSESRSSLTAENVARIRRDLEQRPAELLSDTLRAIVAKKAWVEQEALLATKLSTLKYLLAVGAHC